MTPTGNRSDDDDGGGRDEIAAAEYVLGVQSAEERRRAAARIASDPEFAARVRRWESDLAALNVAYEEVRPPAAILPRIEARLFPTAAPATPSGLPGGLWNSVALWRGLAIGALLAVAGLALVVAGVVGPAPSGRRFVAELAARNGSIGLTAFYDVRTGTLRLTPVAAETQAPKSLQLWMINGKKPPVSLGLVPQNGRGEITVPDNMRRAIDAGTVIAVSLEPQGGSPTGAPTGPVLAAGPARSL